MFCTLCGEELVPKDSFYHEPLGDGEEPHDPQPLCPACAYIYKELLGFGCDYDELIDSMNRDALSPLVP